MSWLFFAIAIATPLSSPSPSPLSSSPSPSSSLSSLSLLSPSPSPSPSPSSVFSQHPLSFLSSSTPHRQSVSSYQQTKPTVSIMTHRNTTFAYRESFSPPNLRSSSSIPKPHEVQNESDFNPFHNETFEKSNASFSTSIRDFQLNLANFNTNVLIKALLYLIGLISGYILRHITARVINSLYRNYRIIRQKIKTDNRTTDIRLNSMPGYPAPKHPAPSGPPLPLRPKNISKNLCCGVDCGSNKQESQNHYETIPITTLSSTSGYDQPVSSSNQPVASSDQPDQSRGLINLNHVSPNYTHFVADSVIILSYFC